MWRDEGRKEGHHFVQTLERIHSRVLVSLPPISLCRSDREEQLQEHLNGPTVAPMWVKLCAYALSLVYIALQLTYIFLFGVNMGPQRTNQWLLSVRELGSCGTVSGATKGIQPGTSLCKS